MKHLASMGALALALALVPSNACDPTAALTQSPLLGELRDDLVVECCNCLSGTSIEAEPDVACPGTANDEKSPCLCDGLNAASCRSALNAEEDVSLLGACVYDQPYYDGGAVEPGPCAGACRGVLAFPE